MLHVSSWARVGRSVVNSCEARICNGCICVLPSHPVRVICRLVASYDPRPSRAIYYLPFWPGYQKNMKYNENCRTMHRPRWKINEKHILLTWSGVVYQRSRTNGSSREHTCLAPSRSRRFHNNPLVIRRSLLHLNSQGKWLAQNTWILLHFRVGFCLAGLCGELITLLIWLRCSTLLGIARVGPSAPVLFAQSERTNKFLVLTILCELL